MSENKYREYLGGEESTSRSPFSDILSGVTKVAGLAAAGFVGYHGFKYLRDSGALSTSVNAVRKATTYAEGVLSGINSTMQSAGVLRTFTGGAKEELKSNLKRTLTPHIIGSMRPIDGAATRFENTLYQLSRSRRQVAGSVIRDTRMDKVLGELRGFVKDKEMYNAFDDMVRKKDSVLRASFDKGNTRPVDNAVRQAIKQLELDKKFSNNPAFSSAQLQLIDILKKHGNRVDFVKDNKDVITEQIRALKKAQEDAIVKHLYEKTGGGDALLNFSKFTGYKKLTVGEAVKRGVFDSSISLKNIVVPGENALKHHGLNPQKMAERAMKSMPGVANAPVDPLLFVDPNGRILDLRFASRVKDKMLKAASNNVQVPFLGIRPFKIMSVLNRESIENMPKFAIFRRGTVMPTINNSIQELKENSYYFAGRLVNKEGKVIRDNTYLASSNFGAIQRSMGAMSGISRRTTPQPTTLWGKTKKAFDIGNQEYESSISRKFSGIKKFWDIDWERNLWYNVTNGSLGASHDAKILNKAYGKFINTVDNNTVALDKDTLEALKPHMSGTVSSDVFDSLLNKSKREGSVEAIYSLLTQARNGQIQLQNGKELEKVIGRYIDDPESFERTVRSIKKGYNIVLPEVAESVGTLTTDLITSLDQAEKLLHVELLHQSQVTTGKTVSDMVAELGSAGKINAKQADSIMDLYLLGNLKGLAKTETGNLSTQNELGKWAGLLSQPKPEQLPLHDHLEKVIKRANPIMGYGPGQPETSAFKGNEFILMNRARNPVDTVKSINETIKSGGNIKDVIRKISEDTLGQAGFGTASIRAGRGKMDKATTFTHGAYYYLFRLNEGLSKIGIGLSYDSIGSAQDIYKNLMLKRWFGPLAVLGGLGYLNYEAGNLMGEKPSQKAGRAYAQMTLDVQSFKDISGLNSVGQRMGQVMPGSDKLYQNPLGMFLKFASFGLLGDSRGRDELKNYYERGYEPVRKSRFWGIGSNTPFYGGRVEYFSPSWYRRMMGQPEMTSSMYGSESEYWANSPIPNPRNPLGILKTAVIDPYHWENKHKKDRPYPVTGGIPEFEMVPILGPLGDMTVGRLLKPPKRNPNLEKAHYEYLTEINEKYKSFLANTNSGAYIQITPGGRITPVMNIGEGVVESGDTSGAYGYNTGSVPGTGGGMGMGIATAEVPGDGGIQVVDPTVGFSQIKSGKYIASAQLTGINSATIAKANLKPIDGRSIQQLRDATFDLDEAGDPNSSAYRLAETWKSATDVGGIYGFALSSNFGEFRPKVIIQSSTRMTGYKRRFWDEGLGGLGGELSEIYRRFLPNRWKLTKEYNPLPNTMPSWLPGQEYFIDFLHGDPYVKITKGEMRLPGAGYESVNKLHPDVFGEYGALDRLKILGDVAPWSDQYRYYDRVVSALHEAGQVSDEDYTEAQAVRDRVSERKKKYDLYPYKFKNAEIDKRTVTVTRMVDSNTFLTKEMPGVPIRLAGIKVSGAQTPEGEEARAEVAKYITVGKKIRIGIEADALNRVYDDVMGTVHAAVYDSWGDPIQRKLVRKNPNIKANYNEKTAAATNALFSSSEITLGKTWETFAHLDTPLHTKFLQIRSPLEMYKRNLVYGKEWQSWEHPIRDWVKPAVDKMSAQNPIVATAVGAGIGWLFGVFAKSKTIGTMVGAAVGGLSSSIRVSKEVAGRTLGNNDYTWIPKRRRTEREIEEYFDMLKYVKYRGLYERTRKIAIRQEGLDPTALVKYSESKAQATNGERRKLEQIKRIIKLSMSDLNNVDQEEAKQRYKMLNDRLASISGDKLLVNTGPMTMRALEYRQGYLSTLYGADPGGDLSMIFKALPKKDRPFFKEFMLATPKEREEILRIVPKNQKRFYEAKWGLPVGDKESVEAYFSNHYLPGPDWAGWKPENSLEETKLKFVKNEALEIGEFGYWEDDMRYINSGTPSIPSMRDPMNFLDIGKLQKVLNGAGIRNADVQISRSTASDPSDRFDINMDISHDRKSDIMGAMNDNMASLLQD